jgi:pyruvate formate lyase activating enzyme
MRQYRTSGGRNSQSSNAEPGMTTRSASGNGEPVGTLFDVKRFCIDDGPGIRTTVFLKGCPLRCLWCHNPEGISAAPQLAHYPSKCIACGRCRAACPGGAISASGDVVVDRSACRICGSCAETCPSGALQTVGRRESVDCVMATVRRDAPFFRTSGGGVTLSGGEPLLQWEFALALLRASRAEALHTAVETSGLGLWPHIEALLPYTDLFLFDLKAVDPDKHRRLCGADNASILSNARALSGTGAQVLFRAPIVPGLNDDPADIDALADLLLSLPGRHSMELLPYHPIGSGKYAALGLEYALAHVRPPDSLERIARVLSGAGISLHNAASGAPSSAASLQG